MTSTTGGGKQVSERAQRFLKVLIERYIRDGQPVGSRTLSKDTGLELSAATVRNVMADLEEMGLVSSPHTSSGRVPTDLGYRHFIDCLLTVKQLAKREVTAMRRQLDGLADASTLIASTSRLLSGATRLAGVVMMPRYDHSVFRRIEFLPMSGNRVLVILVSGEGEVHNRIIHTDRHYPPARLDQTANHLNDLFTGRTLHEVRKCLVADMQVTRLHLDQVMMQAMEMAQEVVEVAEDTEDCLIAGQTNLMECDELADLNQLKQLFDAFTEKNQILHLLDRCIEAEGVQIFVGEESGYQLLDHCSLVTAPYSIEDQAIGVLGVIGPTRMNYPRVIPLVDMTARLLTAALKHS